MPNVEAVINRETKCFKVTMRSNWSTKWLFVIIFVGICLLFYLRPSILNGISTKLPFASKPDDTKHGWKSAKGKFSERIGLLPQNSQLKLQQQRRLRRIHDVCQHYKIDGKVKELYTYSQRNVSYCSNHKVASTYWIRVFRFLHHDTPPGTKRPSNISKYYTHQVPLRRTRKRNFILKKDYEDTMQNYRFMMTRDPYQRLWSVFIDKFVLLDLYFWKNFFRDIRTNFLREFGGVKDLTRRIDLASIFEPPLQSVTTNEEDQMSHLRTETQLKPTNLCKQLSFEEFLIYVVNTGKSSLKSMNDHFQPVYIGCNPCVFKPDFVGKVETLDKEKGFLLERLGLSADVDGEDSFEEYVRHEIIMLSQFQFDLLRDMWSAPIPCVTMKNIQERITTAFVLNGYLPFDSLETMSQLVPMVEDKFVGKLIELFRNSNRTKITVHKQRESMRKDAYKKIPFQSLLSLQKIYENDFLLFGYESQPSYIFEDRIDFDIKKVFG